jgi:thiol-disulfide isomerase/thioredoxin
MGMGKLKKHQMTALKWSRDLILLGLFVLIITWWQSRDLLEDDGSLVMANGNLVTLNSDVQPLFTADKRTLVYFFAPWCKICEASIGNLDALEDPSLRIVKIALDYQSRNEVETFVNNNDVSGDVFLGTEHLKQQYQVPGYPTYYFLNEQRQVIGRSFGYSTTIGLKLKNYLNK